MPAEAVRVEGAREVGARERVTLVALVVVKEYAMVCGDSKDPDAEAPECLMLLKNVKEEMKGE